MLSSACEHGCHRLGFETEMQQEGLRERQTDWAPCATMFKCGEKNMFEAIESETSTAT